MAEKSQLEQIQERWPAYAWAINIPELKDVLLDSTITDANQLQAKIQNTNWWKATKPAERNWLARNQLDPAGAAQDLGQKAADIWDMYLGVGLQPNVQDVNDLATQALKFGWTQNQVLDAVTSHMQFSYDMMKQVGNMQSTAAQLKTQAEQYGLTPSVPDSFGWARQVVNGEQKAENFFSLFKAQAIQKFSYSPDIVNAIELGHTVSDFIAPMQQQVAKMLEVQPDQVDLINNPQYQQILDYNDPASKTRRLMTSSEIGTFVRGKDAWKKTAQGQEAASTAAEGILNLFGKVSGGSSGSASLNTGTSSS